MYIHNCVRAHWEYKQIPKNWLEWSVTTTNISRRIGQMICVQIFRPFAILMIIKKSRNKEKQKTKIRRVTNLLALWHHKISTNVAQRTVKFKCVMNMNSEWINLLFFSTVFDSTARLKWTAHNKLTKATAASHARSIRHRWIACVSAFCGDWRERNAMRCKMNDDEKISFFFCSEQK